MLPPNPGELHMTRLLKSVHAHSPAFCFNHPKWEPRFETLGEIQLRKGIKCDFTLTGSLDITLPCGFSCALNKDSEAMLGAGAQVSVPALQGPGQGAQPQHSASIQAREAPESCSCPPPCCTNCPQHICLPKIPVTPNPHQLGISQSRDSSCSWPANVGNKLLWICHKEKKKSAIIRIPGVQQMPCLKWDACQLI